MTITLKLFIITGIIFLIGLVFIFFTPFLFSIVKYIKRKHGYIEKNEKIFDILFKYNMIVVTIFMWISFLSFILSICYSIYFVSKNYEIKHIQLTENVFKIIEKNKLNTYAIFFPDSNLIYKNKGDRNFLYEGNDKYLLILNKEINIKSGTIKINENLFLNPLIIERINNKNILKENLKNCDNSDLQEFLNTFKNEQ